MVRGDVTEPEVQDVCRGSLADYKIPREVHVREEALPQTSTMKIDKVSLRAELG